MAPLAFDTAALQSRGGPTSLNSLNNNIIRGARENRAITLYCVELITNQMRWDQYRFVDGQCLAMRKRLQRWLAVWGCRCVGSEGDDDVSALFMSVLRRCRRHTATDHSVPHEWKINKPQMGVWKPEKVSEKKMKVCVGMGGWPAFCRLCAYTCHQNS